MKLVDGSEFETTRNTIAATKLGEDDSLVGVQITRITSKPVEDEEYEMPNCINRRFR